MFLQLIIFSSRFFSTALWEKKNPYRRTAFGMSLGTLCVSRQHGSGTGAMFL